MKKTTLLILIFVFTNAGIAFSQWEYQYFVLKLGVNHNFSSTKSSEVANKYLLTPAGHMKLKPSSSSTNYVPGFTAGMNFHYDFQSDNAGIIFGAEFNRIGYKSKFETVDETNVVRSKFTLTETYQMSTISFPVLLKLGREMFDKQRYFFIGGQFNLNRKMQTIQQVDWKTEKGVVKALPDEILKNNIVLIAGFNYLVFNVQVEYMTKNFMNPAYIYFYDVNNTENPKDDIQYTPYSTLPKHLVFVRTSLNIPLSAWTTKKNYTVYKIWKRIKFW